jgi:hypothetical protein
MAARVSGQTPRRAPAGERRRWRDRDRHGLVASVHDRRAERLELARTYCQAVLSHDRRISLDGAPAEPVDGEAKELAAKQLAKLAARKASAKSAKKVAAHAAADVKPAPAPPAPHARRHPKNCVPESARHCRGEARRALDLCWRVPRSLAQTKLFDYGFALAKR